MNGPGTCNTKMLSNGGAALALHACNELCDRGVGCIAGDAVAVGQFAIAEPMRDAAQVAPPRQDLGARHQEKRAQQATVRLATVPGHLDDQAPPVNKVLKWSRGIHLQLPAVQSPWLPTVDAHRQAAKE